MSDVSIENKNFSNRWLIGGNGYKTMWMYLPLFNCVLEMIKMNFILFIFLSNFSLEKQNWLFLIKFS